MEDISRELEKELKAHSRPVPAKRKIKTELYFINEIGEIASAAWIKPLVGLLALLTFLSTATAGVFVYFYTNSGAEQSELACSLAAREKRVQQLVSEKELLMARLVLSGKDSALAVALSPGEKPAGNGGKSGVKKSAAAPRVAPGPKVAKVKPETAKKQKKTHPKPKPKPQAQAKAKVEKKKAESVAKVVKSLPKKVGVEGLKVIRDGNNGDLLVRFDIRNISVGSNNISGYIYVILKPATGGGNDWLVVPSVAMNKGKPAVYRKGQYFSIAHFKPVNFRVKTQLAPDSFKTATVFIYNEEGGLMFQRDMALAQSKG
ncbi:MAG: hypothetical protein GY737_15745 [Desulfobacteraceae bacterium]|nr:hypothetical protein [Desulfobacteraceae bacterium]